MSCMYRFLPGCTVRLDLEDPGQQQLKQITTLKDSTLGWADESEFIN